MGRERERGGSDMMDRFSYSRSWTGILASSIKSSLNYVSLSCLQGYYVLLSSPSLLKSSII